MSVFVSKIESAWQQGKPNHLPEPASSSMGGVQLDRPLASILSSGHDRCTTSSVSPETGEGGVELPTGTKGDLRPLSELEMQIRSKVKPTRASGSSLPWKQFPFL